MNRALLRLERTMNLFGGRGWRGGEGGREGGREHAYWQQHICSDAMIMLAYVFMR